jgi:hypothetical protein
VAAVLRVCITCRCCFFLDSPMLGYESRPVSGSGEGPQRSVEGWVVFVTRSPVSTKRRRF